MFKQWLFDYLPRHRQSPLLRRIDRWCQRFHESFENRNYDFHHNGEKFVLDTLRAQPDVQTILDVGANIGDWAVMAATAVPSAQVHSFEIIPNTFDILRRNCKEFSNIHPNSVGLSDTPGEIPVAYSQDMNANATCVPGITEMFHKITPHTVTAKVTTGDIFCERAGIGRIDFLKLDVEGFEPQVLRGFRGKLDAGQIKMIQFEYGYVNIVVKFLLKDFYDFLTPYGMRIGKIYPNRVEFRDYDLYEENFFGPNYLAVHESMVPLISALKG